jgi:hypothetical protein
MGSMIVKCSSYIFRKLSPRYFSSYFLFHKLNGDIVRKALIRCFTVAGDARPEGFVRASGCIRRQTAWSALKARIL